MFIVGCPVWFWFTQKAYNDPQERKRGVAAIALMMLACAIGFLSFFGLI